MNAIGIDASKATGVALAVEPDAIPSDGDEDQEWHEFLVLGLATDLIEPACAMRWQRAPVLLSY